MRRSPRRPFDLESRTRPHIGRLHRIEDDFMRTETTRTDDSSATRRLLQLALALLVAATASIAVAQSSGPASGPKRTPGEVSNIVEELSQELYSPYCPGKTIAMCPSGGAAELRREIQKMARRGLSKAQIKERLLSEYGEKYRIEAPPREDNYPLLGLIAGGFVVCAAAVYLLSRRGDDAEREEPSPVEEDLDEDEEIYLDELRSEYTD